MLIDIKEIKNFAEFCKTVYQVDDIGMEGDALQQLLYSAWKNKAAKTTSLDSDNQFPEWAAKDISVVRADNKTTKEAKIVSPALKLNNEVRDLHARVVVTKGVPVYSLFLAIDDLEKIGRTRKPRYPLPKDSIAHNHVQKLWTNNRNIFVRVESHKDKIQYDSIKPVCSAFVSMKKDFNSIKGIADVKLFTFEEAKPIANVSTNIKLQVFTRSISKTDPLLLEDKMLKLWRYNPQTTNLSDKDQEDIRGRIGEIVFRSENNQLEWVNELMEQGESFDYKVPGTKLTVDIKTICSPSFNLLLKKRKVDANSLADVFSLLLVEDMGNEYQVSCYGFISKEDALRFITEYPRCLIPKIDSYKIERRQLDPQFVIEIK